MSRTAAIPESLQARELLLAPERVLLRDGPARDHAVHVVDGRFAAVGPRDELTRRLPKLPVTELPGRLLMPGFIDAHHHLTQSFGKSLAYGEPSEIFRRVWVPLESSLGEDFVHVGAKLAALESLRGGFTTICDAGTRASGAIDAIASAVESAGLRCVLGLTCNDVTASDTERDRIVTAAEQFLARPRGDGLVHPSLAISVPEAGSDAMLQKVSALCGEAGAIFQTHVNEHLASVERSVVARGLRPLELLSSLGALGPQVLIAHATLVTPSELAILRDTDTAVAYNPVASMWKGNAVAPALAMATLGIRFGLGTDSTRSDAFRLVDAAEAAQKLAFALPIGDASCGAGWTWLDHATTDGAAACGLGGITGEIAPGLAADFLLVDIDVPEMCTTVDLTWDLVRIAGRDQIEAVFVAGRMRLWQGWPVDWDARALMREVAAVAGRAIAEAPIQRLHLPAAEHRRRAMSVRH
ncbi:MAG: amidohydrolase family protein [Proteobacteria bacterium]|nr:amidohydrolase family protein [Pseudomonadota bacterium]